MQKAHRAFFLMPGSFAIVASLVIINRSGLNSAYKRIESFLAQKEVLSNWRGVGSEEEDSEFLHTSLEVCMAIKNFHDSRVCKPLFSREIYDGAVCPLES